MIDCMYRNNLLYRNRSTNLNTCPYNCLYMYPDNCPYKYSYSNYTPTKC